MSGPRETRDSADAAGTSDVPAQSAPPSFGGSTSPVEEPSAADTVPTPFTAPAFGLEAPWWAAESADTAPPAGDDASNAAEPPAEPPANSSAEPPAEPSAGDDELVFGADTADDRPSEPEASAAAPPGTLVAGVGVPRVDSRRAVPAKPIVKRPPSSGDTDPDGIPAVRPEEDAPVVKETVVGQSEAPSAFQKAKDAEDATSATLAPVLVPDAILPPGFTPPTGSGPFPTTAADGTVVAEQQPGMPPTDTPPHPRVQRGGGGGSKRRILLVGGGAAVILAAAIGLFTIGGSDSGKKDGNGKVAESPAATRSTPPPAAPAAPVDITNEKTDTQDLAFHDIFPTETISLGGRTYSRERWSLNRDVSYAARGAMLKALQREQCRKIVRATYIDRASKLAVTSGIAVMPTKEAALTISKAGNPAKYEWFRGLGGKHAPDLDQAGGYAAATVRGRYVAYAYVQWANGKKAEPGDATIKQAAQQFLDYDLRPIVARAGG
ncbi:hypothetical protein [Actinomadura meridiana]